MAVILRATWTARPGAEDTVRAALAELAPLVRQEPGNLGFTVYGDPAVPTVFHLFEVYEDQAAVEAHGATEHFARIVLGRAVPLLADRRREFFDRLEI